MTVRILFVVLALVLACTGAVIAADDTAAGQAELRTTADVDSARFVEFASIFGGRVLGYSSHDHMAKDGMMGDHHMKEGAKCHGDHMGGCCEESCGCCEMHYDCWGVWQGDENNFAATRDSDYDPVMGRGQSGGDGIWGWHGW